MAVAHARTSPLQQQPLFLPLATAGATTAVLFQPRQWSYLLTQISTSSRSTLLSLDTMIRLARFNIITACDGDGMVFMVCWWSVPPSISICHLGSSVENAHHSLQKKKTPTSQELPAAPAHHRLASSSERRPCQSPRRRGAQLARCLGFSPPSLQGSPNPSNRSGPVWTGIKPIQIQNLNSKK